MKISIRVWKYLVFSKYLFSQVKIVVLIKIVFLFQQKIWPLNQIFSCSNQIFFCLSVSTWKFFKIFSNFFSWIRKRPLLFWVRKRTEYFLCQKFPVLFTWSCDFLKRPSCYLAAAETPQNCSRNPRTRAAGFCKHLVGRDARSTF